MPFLIVARDPARARVRQRHNGNLNKVVMFDKPVEQRDLSPVDHIFGVVKNDLLETRAGAELFAFEFSP